MADVKISQLPSASTPLAGTEEIPLVQSSTTKKITVSNLLTSANLGTPTAVNLANATNVPMTQASGVLPVANGGTGTTTPSLVAGSNVTVTGTWPNQTIAATGGGGGSGTVTSMSVVSANGLAGTVANATTTPAVTLSTSVTGIVKGNGTALSAATAGTDYVAPGGALGTPSSGTATNLTGLPLSTGVTGTLPVANGGTGTTSPALVAGTNVTITGTWPNQTINSSGGGSMTYPGAGIANSTGSAWGTSYTTTGTGTVLALATSPTFVTPALGTPSSATLTNATGLPISTGVSGLGTGVATFLGTPSSANLAAAVTDETGTGALVFANSPTLVTPALGTPSALVGTNITGTAAGLTAGNVTTNANLTGAVTSVGNATSLGSFSSANLSAALTDETGSGSAVFATSPTLVTPILGTPTSVTLTNATGLPIATGVSGLGTGVATALAVNVGSAGAPVVNGGALGTPSSGTLTNATGLPISTGVSGLGTGVATALAVAVGSAGAPVVNGGALGTPSSGTLTNATGLPIATGVSGLGTGVATFLTTPSSANLLAAVTDETGTGSLVFGTAPAITNPTVTNYVETPYSANSSTAITLALTNGTVQIITLTGNATITMPTATSGKSFILLLKQDATGSRTVTWSTVVWPGGTAPTITATASKQDIYSFFADGTNWYGVTVGQNY